MKERYSVRLALRFGGNANWNHPGKELAFEFHGNYQGIIRWLRELEKVYPHREFLPIEDARITNQCGYIFEGSSNQMEFIENNSYVSE